ncbi:MAG: hypothetical protein U0802_12525 [Candidatus Binatia bacterium]
MTGLGAELDGLRDLVAQERRDATAALEEVLAETQAVRAELAQRAEERRCRRRSPTRWRSPPNATSCAASWPPWA